MPLYEYYCPKCSTKFELLRPMKSSDEPAACPAGHAGAARTLSVFASVAKDEVGSAADYTMPSGGGCACGGGGCGCGH